MTHQRKTNAESRVAVVSVAHDTAAVRVRSAGFDVQGGGCGAIILMAIGGTVELDRMDR